MNDNINPNNQLIDHVLANLNPVLAPQPVVQEPPAQGLALHLAAANLAQQFDAVQALPAPNAPPVAEEADPVTPPAPNVAQPLIPPGAPRAPGQLGPGLHMFHPFNAHRIRNLGPVFEAIAREPVTPVATASNQSTQAHFSPPSVCKPGTKRPYQRDDSDDSPPAGRGWQVRV